MSLRRLITVLLTRFEHRRIAWRPPPPRRAAPRRSSTRCSAGVKAQLHQLQRVELRPPQPGRVGRVRRRRVDDSRRPAQTSCSASIRLPATGTTSATQLEALPSSGEHGTPHDRSRRPAAPSARTYTSSSARLQQPALSVLPGGASPSAASPLSKAEEDGAAKQGARRRPRAGLHHAGRLASAYPVIGLAARVPGPMEPSTRDSRRRLRSGACVVGSIRQKSPLRWHVSGHYRGLCPLRRTGPPPPGSSALRSP